MPYFYSVNKDVQHEIKLKRSRFICHLHYCKTLIEAKEYIQQINKEYQTANHNCWAYIVGENGENAHSSDAGEPSGSAGKPMLNTLRKHDMTNIVAVVTRYFGGVKLGIRGLIDAYAMSVEETITQDSLKKIVNYSYYSINLNYDFIEKFKYDIGELSAEIYKINYAAKIDVTLMIEDIMVTGLENYLQEMSGKKKITYKSITL